MLVSGKSGSFFVGCNVLLSERKATVQRLACETRNRGIPSGTRIKILRRSLPFSSLDYLPMPT